MNAKTLSGVILLACSGIFSLMGLAAIFAIVHALSVRSTLPAVESAFGSTVIAIGLFVTARVCFKAGTNRLASSDLDQGH